MIKTERLTRRYDTLTAVDGVSFEAHPGEVLGFLGPNGAGKTTTMRMIAGFIAPTEGTASICGHDIEREPLAAKARLGYLPEGAPGYGEMSVRGFLEFIADLRGLAGAARRTRLDQVTERLALGGVAAQTIDTLSKGFRRRVGIAQAILHDPPVLILDEPTDGLDPNQKHEVRTLINEMAANKTIVVSTHILEEVAAVCTRAIIIARGRIVADDTPQGLAARSRYHNAVSLRLARPGQFAAASAALAALPQVASVETDEPALRLTALPRDGADLLAEVNALAARDGIALQALELEPGRLDEVFRGITA
ncbi:MAG: ABC transporter ATP-binding protein [Steroidobacteraceae bacterium]